MRILYLHQYFCPPDGWGNTRSLELSQHWVQAGHQVEVVTTPALFPQAGTQAMVQTIAGARVHVLPVAYSHGMSYWGRIRAFGEFYRELLAYCRKLPRPDLIYASSTPLTVPAAGRSLARYHRCPWIFEAVDVWPDVPIGMGILRNPLLTVPLHAWTNRLYRSANLVVALSEGMSEQITRHGIPASHVLVSHNGTNPDQFHPAPARASEPPVRLLYAGTIGPANGVEQLIEALVLLDQQFPTLQWHCDLLGWGKSLAAVQRLVPAPLAPRIQFHPPVPKRELLPWLQRSHIGLVTFAPYPVLEANSANKFYDYLAAGLPVCLNYEGWQARYLNDWNAGLAAPQAHVQAFTNNLARLIQDAPLREQMGRNARRLAEAKFDRRHLAAELLVRMDRLIA